MLPWLACSYFFNAIVCIFSEPCYPSRGGLKLARLGCLYPNWKSAWWSLRVFLACCQSEACGLCSKSLLCALNSVIKGVFRILFRVLWFCHDGFLRRSFWGPQMSWLIQDIFHLHLIIRWIEVKVQALPCFVYEPPISNGRRCSFWLLHRISNELIGLSNFCGRLPPGILFFVHAPSISYWVTNFLNWSFVKCLSYAFYIVSSSCRF